MKLAYTIIYVPDVPASCLRRELKALEHSRGQPEGSMLVALRGSKR